MKIHGHTVRDYFRLLAPLFGLIAIVWALRLALGLFGAPLWIVRLVSVSAALALAVVIAVLLIHVRRFGSYPHVFLVSFLLVAWREVLIIGAILFSVATGKENIFTAPEFSIPGDDPNHIRHILGHLTFGIGAGTLLGGLIGCLLLWMLRKIVPPRPTR
ncbi:MAG TPA: hypothetical protein VID27_03910 [Blastocatellia bacterium]|jgi:hypothetical protein